jgi:hypothetical protein
MANGKEKGANDLWKPGGYTVGGYPEAVIDQIPSNSYQAKQVIQ